MPKVDSITPSVQIPAQRSEQVLQALMKAADIRSYRALAERANVSRWQIQQLRSGNIERMRVAMLNQIAAALTVSLTDLLQRFSDPVDPSSVLRDSTALSDNRPTGESFKDNSSEDKSAKDRSITPEQIQREALQTIETWLTQWATIAKRAQERGDALPAVKVLPFVRPVEQLMREWDVVSFAAIDEQVPYDPQQHQVTKGIVSPGDIVQVTHVGYTHHGKLLHRAKVKAVS